jgi:hypothetical protein
VNGASTDHVIESAVFVRASAERLWREVTLVDIASFRHPAYLRALGIPKPLRASVLAERVGGARVAYFSNGLRFAQEITEWTPCRSYGFTFSADRGFRVGWVLDLSAGPFRLRSGRYLLDLRDDGIELTLTTRYCLSGVAGAVLRFPVALVLRLFQKYLLSGIRKNAERPLAESRRDA